MRLPAPILRPRIRLSRKFALGDGTKRNLAPATADILERSCGGDQPPREQLAQLGPVHEGDV
eukprot:6671996-Pyramimonas_sp.AAC.1